MSARRFGTGTHPATQTGVLKGWHVLAGLLGFFGTIIAVNAVFITAAVRTFPGEDTERSYTQGLAFNSTLEARAAQAALGWHAALAFEPSASGLELVARVTDASGRGVGDLVLTGTLRRPVDAGADRPVVFSPIAGQPGLYAAPLGTLPEGQWDLNAESPLPEGDRYNLTGNLTWPMPQR